jgi:hypothetical protein
MNAKRRRETGKVIKRRLKQLESAGITDSIVVEQPHRLAKRHAFGCRQPGCLFCKKEKKPDWYTGERLDDRPLEELVME